MKFQVLADDAAACNQLADNLRGALKNLNLDVPVEMDASPSLIANLNVGSPVLAEDHRVIASGKMLSTAEITELLTGLHGAEIDKLRIAAERSKKKAHLFKGILLLIAILCGVFAIVNEIRQRRAEAAAEAARPVVLRYTRPIRMIYFYRRPRTDDDVNYEVLLRRVAYAAFPEEIRRKTFSIESLDGGSAANAPALRKYGINSFPAVVLIQDERFLPLVIADDEIPQKKLMQTADLLNNASAEARKE
jgi:hypothetical protein